MTDRTAGWQTPTFLAWFGLPVLFVYACAQGAISLFVGAQHQHLKLVIEPNLLLLGLILHVHWRHVGTLYAELGQDRPWWIGLADCVSFVITFWALWVLLEVFMH
jgi:hypothetical protein